MKQIQAPACGHGDSICPVMHSISIVGNKWVIPILFVLEQLGQNRYGALKRLLSGITDTMLAQTLKELERHRLVLREQFNEIPPHVEYSLTQEGRALARSLKQMAAWSVNLLSAEYHARVCTTCMGENYSAVFEAMHNEPSRWDEQHEKLFETFQTDACINEKTGLEKLKLFVRNAIEVLTQNDLAYARRTYVYMFQEGSPMLVGDDRPYYIYLNQLVAQGLADGSLDRTRSHEELVQIISSMQTGMIAKWQMSLSTEDVLVFNEAPFQWLFEMIASKDLL